MTISLGLESGTVRVVSYDSAWPNLFAFEAARLREYFAAVGLLARIEHTGSTAVPGLAAKPILDIMIGCPEDAVVSEYIKVLALAEYTHRGQQGIPGREFFRRGDPRAYHVHLTRIASQFWFDHLTFRDCLRADDALRDAYAELKRDLAARFPRDREAYIAAKEPFVRQVLRIGVVAPPSSSSFC